MELALLLLPCVDNVALNVIYKPIEKDIWSEKYNRIQSKYIESESPVDGTAELCIVKYKK